MASELRKKWWTVPVGHLMWFFITLICFTLRKRIIIEDAEGKKFGSYQCIIALWHNRVFVPCYVYRYCVKGKKVQMSMLTSASKDGALLATVAKDYVSVILWWEARVNWTLIPTVVVEHNECFAIGLNFLCGGASLVIEKKGKEQI